MKKTNKVIVMGMLYLFIKDRQTGLKAQFSAEHPIEILTRLTSHAQDVIFQHFRFVEKISGFRVLFFLPFATQSIYRCFN